MNLRKNFKRFLFFLATILIGGIIAYKVTYKPHVTIQEKKVDYKGTSQLLLEKIEKQPNKWNNKTVEISGEITQIDPHSFMIGSQIFCQKNTNTKSLAPLTIGDTYHIKGRIIGYDDLLEELKLDQVILIK